MLNTLRNRLFASYLVVLSVALVLLSIVLFTVLQTQEVPPELTWSRLEFLLRGFASQQAVREFLGQGARNFDYETILDSFAEDNGVRVMLVGRNQDRHTVIYDSADILGDNTNVDFESNESSRPRNNNNPQGQGQAAPLPNIETGRFVDGNGEEWLFTAIERDVARQNLFRYEEVALLLASPRSSESFASAFGSFREVFLPPIIQAACISGILALAFAIFISRSIVRPLQALSSSAQNVANGHLNEKVPVTGTIETRQVAEAFNVMTENVQATQDSQREFLANVSHDLKTPLTSIQGYSQAIMDGAARNPAEAAGIIHEEAGRLTRMVTELTDLARLQAGRLSMKLTALDVGQIVAAIGQRLSVVAAKQNIELSVQTAPMPMIAADGDRLVQVLMNLIGNAIKYTPNGGKVWVSTGIRAGGVEITVQDNGIGIPKEDLPRIFERFYQVDKSRGPQRGTGLGLAITREIVLAHGGKIDIESDGRGKGTKVIVWLPSPQLSTIISRR